MKETFALLVIFQEIMELTMKSNRDSNYIIHQIVIPVVIFTPQQMNSFTLKMPRNAFGFGMATWKSILIF